MLHFDFHFFAVVVAAANSHNARLPFCESAGVYLCFSLFLVFLFLRLFFSLSRCRPLCSAYYVQFHLVILNIIMCTNVLFNYDYMTERRRQPNFHIAIVLECRRVCVYYKIVHEAVNSRKILHSSWCEFKTIICSHTHFSMVFVFVCCYLCHCSFFSTLTLYGRGFNYVWK